MAKRLKVQGEILEGGDNAGLNYAAGISDTLYYIPAVYDLLLYQRPVLLTLCLCSVEGRRTLALVNV